MDWEAIRANWGRLQPLAKARWPEVEVRDLDRSAGDRSGLNRAIARHLQITEQEAAHQTQEWAQRLKAQAGDVPAAPLRVINESTRVVSETIRSHKPDAAGSTPAPASKKQV